MLHTDLLPFAQTVVYLFRVELIYILLSSERSQEASFGEESVQLLSDRR